MIFPDFADSLVLYLSMIKFSYDIIRHNFIQKYCKLIKFLIYLFFSKQNNYFFYVILEESSNALSANIHKYITNKSITDNEYITLGNNDERTNAKDLKEKSQTDENRGSTVPIELRSGESRALPPLETLRVGDSREEHDYIELGTRSDRATSEDINSLLSRDTIQHIGKVPLILMTFHGTP